MRGRCEGEPEFHFDYYRTCHGRLDTDPTSVLNILSIRLIIDQRALVCASELCDRLEKSSRPPRSLPRCRRSSLPAVEPSTALALHLMAPTMAN